MPDRRGHPHRDRAPRPRTRRIGGRQAPHRPQPQRPGRDRPAPLPAPRRRADAGWRAPRAAGRARRAGAEDRRHVPARLHAPPARAAGAARAPPARALLGLRARRRPLARRARRAPTCRRSAPARSPARACRSTPTASPADLGFARRFENSLDAVSDRDFVAEALFVAALTQVHLSRLGEEIVLWTTEEFGFLRLADAYTHRVVDAAAEEEPRHRRARAARRGRADRRPHRRARHAQGPAARVQPRPPGGQGAAVRRLDTCGVALAAVAGLRRHRRVRRRAHAGCGRRRRHRRDRPRRVARAAGRAVPRGARSSARWCASRVERACRSTSS